jgi:MFS transporter, ACS family, 4-hydroxyphenylacetate permease
MIALVAGAAFGWVVVILADTAMLKMIGVTLYSGAIFSAFAIFWAMVPPLISRNDQPMVIAVITTMGILASVVSPSIIGALRDITHSFAAGLWYATLLLMIGLVCIRIGSRNSRLDVSP